MVDKDLTHLHPLLEPLCRQFLVQCTSNNLVVRITETWRDPTREDALHAQGITAATGLTCKHCFMLNHKPASKAFDFIILSKDGGVINDGTDEHYSLAGSIGKKLGLFWGGDFHHPDYDHFEIA